MRMHLTAVTAEDQQWEQLLGVDKTGLCIGAVTQSQIIELGDDLWAVRITGRFGVCSNGANRFLITSIYYAVQTVVRFLATSATWAAKTDA